jgi:hypothetical protein
MFEWRVFDCQVNVFVNSGRFTVVFAMRMWKKKGNYLVFLALFFRVGTKI